MYRKYSIMAQSWVDRGLRIAEQTKNPQAHEIMHFLGERVVVGHAHGDQITALDQPRHAESIMLIPVIGSADHASNAGKMLAAGNNPIRAAMFQAHFKFLLINGDIRLHPVLEGVSFLHEGYHAIKCLRDSSLLTEDPLIARRHERDTVNFQNELLQAALGEEYTELLNQEVRLIERRLNYACTSWRNLFVHNKYHRRFPQELDAAFGPAANETERIARGGYFVSHAIFEFFNRHADEKAVDFQVAYTGEMLMPPVVPQKQS